jgi:hypothetical protein
MTSTTGELLPRNRSRLPRHSRPLIDKNQQSELDKCRALVQAALDQTKKAT